MTTAVSSDKMAAAVEQQAVDIKIVDSIDKKDNYNEHDDNKQQPSIDHAPVSTMVCCRNVRDFIIRYRSLLIVYITPLILLPLPLLVTDQIGRCGFMLLLMGVYWCTEALPLAVTGFIPVFLAPMFGILSTKEVCVNYFKDSALMFVGGVIVALAVENSNLHRRIALKVLLIFGTKAHWLMMGSMLPTWFLSMWISNTAAVAMMLPILEAIMEQLDPNILDQKVSEDAEELQSPEETKGQDQILMTNGKMESKESNVEDGESDSKEDEQQSLEAKTKEDEKYKHFCVVMTLAVTYAANIGGIGALTGTSTNIVMAGIANSIWDDNGLGESPVNYTSWMVMGLPLAVVNLFIAWVWMNMYLRGPRGLLRSHRLSQAAEDRIQEIIKKQHTALGGIRFAECVAGVMFSMVVVLCFTRAPGFMPGWASSYPLGYINDAVPVLFIAFVLFALPYNMPSCGSRQGTAPIKTMLNWPFVQQKYPWQILFIFGGGFALAQCCERSGLSVWMAAQLAIVCAPLPASIMVFVASFLVCMLTQITTNAATTTIMMPVMAAMSESVGKSPLYLMFPGALSASFSHMLPVSNPPNAVAFSYGRLKIMDMVKAGFVLNVLGVLTATIATLTWGYSFFDMGVIPWAIENGNLTAIATTVLP
jgi:sodium-dependent dicarboxylate transporter 2/3/5